MVFPQDIPEREVDSGDRGPADDTVANLTLEVDSVDDQGVWAFNLGFQVFVGTPPRSAMPLWMRRIWVAGWNNLAVYTKQLSKDDVKTALMQTVDRIVDQYIIKFLGDHVNDGPAK